MEITASLPQKHSRGLICRIRKVLVADTPEERVRQELLAHLTGPAGYSPSLIAVEVPLKSLVPSALVPRRRLDIVCFAPASEGLVPVLLIECKAAAPRGCALCQLNGYNRYLRAAAAALAWPGHIAICRNGAIVYEGSVAQMPAYTPSSKSRFGV